MSPDRRRPPGASGQAALPWWLGGGVGLLLTMALGAGVWTYSWGLAPPVEVTPLPVMQPWQGPQTELAAVAVMGERLPTPDRRRDSDVESETEPSWPTDPALQARRLEERQQARIERAIRSDEELAAFIEAVGVLEPLELWVAPIDGAYRITATFGQAGSLWSSDHTGVDLAAPSGTPVASVAAGTVTAAGDEGAYGLRVEVTHPDGTETSYSHLSRIDVTEGQVVQQGTTVGAVGSTGNSTGPHLHLELRSGGVPVDPVPALLARGVAL